MYEDKIASIVSLAKFAFSNLPDDSSFHQRLHSCFLLFTDLLPFDSPLDLEDFFRAHHFDNRRPIHTLYGTITACDVSRKLQKLVLQRSRTLQKLCFVNLIRTSPPHMEMEMLLKLPPHLFRQYIITAFAILWFPMSHAQFHSEDIERSIPDDLQVVFRFLANPYVFEKMYEVCRDVQIFIASWLQHAHFYSVRDPTGQVIPSATHLLDQYSSQIPLVPPHHFSNQLLINLRELFNRAIRVKHNTAAEVTSVALLGLKVSNFLCESSEYVHALKVAQVIHEAVRTFFGPSQCHRVQLRLEYEILCVMLRSMNSFNMYVDPEDQQVFLKESPNLLKALNQFDLLFHPSDVKVACISPVLPPNLSSATNLSCVSPVRQTTSFDCTDESLADDLMGSVAAIASGPSGDSFDPNSQEDSFIQSPPFLPEPYFPTTTADSDLVLALLSDSPGPSICAAYMHAQLANYYYVMCKYEVAYQFTLLAIGQLQASTSVGLVPSPQVTIEVLRIMCKICMIKRKYDLGLKIIRHALLVCRTYFGMHNLIYASLLLEYGCVLLNTDKTRRAARVYRVGLALITNCLPGASIMAALSLEAISYAQYVLEYTSGDFTYALDCADMAGVMLRRLNHETSMQAASANRVKALIIEEIAIDDNDAVRTKEYLACARDLHMQSLNLCERTFGLWNIQTAKHFGNLGRLYQSMQDNKKAEMMHRKAIMIKERLLGSSDFEVGLSVGHLASLYNYDMDRYEDAEQLYLRSVEISLNLFGSTYSGLEYDYRGLQRVYHELGNRTDMRRYQALFDQWQKDRKKLQLSEPIEVADEVEPIDFAENEEKQWCLFYQITTDYEQEFKGIFRDLGLAVDEGTRTLGSSRAVACTLGGGTEASRSTGY
ncbi:uncharacterized protein DEA37_0007217 [Paragonimus westermani]|uniref:Amyloid protein-binding protein 2 n=1 Tax=Paragonimus westermani TaxID=34504 RepID=A0A5J4NIL5_9TREM|nr:uncharacterized protein DEA37_0007217 [Paragonimus westermani]